MPGHRVCELDADSLKRIIEANIPLVLIDRKIPGLDANFVGGDDELIGSIATEHLVEIGCKHIAHVGGAKVSPARGRLEGYKKTLAKHHMSPGPNYIAMGESLDHRAHETGYESATKLLKLNPRPDGIFCFSDPLAIGAIRAILESGLRIPEDVALIGCGNLHYDAFCACRSAASISKASRSVNAPQPSPWRLSKAAQRTAQRRSLAPFFFRQNS